MGAKELHKGQMIKSQFISLNITKHTNCIKCKKNRWNYLLQGLYGEKHTGVKIILSDHDLISNNKQI